MNAVRLALGVLVAAALAGTALAASAAQPTAITGSVTSVSATGATITGTVNPNGESTTWKFEWGKSTSYGSETQSQSAGSGSGNVAVAASLSNLDAATTYHYRLVATNEDGTARGADGIFTTGGSRPTVVTGDATGIGPRHATLNGTVDPNGRLTEYWFEWGGSTRYGNRTKRTAVGNGGDPLGVAAEITGLTPGKTYHYRLVARSGAGTARGVDRTFRADPPPEAITDEATQVTSSSAVLRGRVDANGRPTSYYFEYGRTRSYGSRTPTADAGFGSDPAEVSLRVTGLRTDRTYHFRLVAVNDAGRSKGKNRRLRTTTGPSVTTGPVSRVTATTAEVSAVVVPGGRSTGAWIEYGTSTRYGSRTATQDAGSGFEPVSVGFVLTGLRPGVTYHYRARAQNGDGRSDGRDGSFRTPGGPPTATTGNLTSLGPFTARLTGVVTPGGLPTTTWFEWGRTRALGTRTAGVTHTGTARRQVVAPLGGLAPGRRYFYRLVAVSEAGSSVGRIASFGTPPLPRDARGRVVRCTIVGTQWPDVLRGTNGRDVICGFGGNDRIIGRGGNDVIYAGPGDDRVDAGAGRDTVFGGSGRDEIVGGSGHDVLHGQGGADRLFGNAGNDRLEGLLGRDTLIGGGGRDILRGGADADTIFARDGQRDVVAGGGGVDTATLDRGRDRFGSIERRRF